MPSIPVGGLAQGVGPQRHVDGVRPARLGKDQLLSRRFGEVANGLLGYSVLKMGIDAAERERLPGLVAVADEGIVLEATIVGVIATDIDTMVTGKALECLLGSNRLLAGE